jgi:hypothetical protein
VSKDKQGKHEIVQGMHRKIQNRIGGSHHEHVCSLSPFSTYGNEHNKISQLSVIQEHPTQHHP